MSLNVREIREGLAEALGTLGLRTISVLPTGSVTLPVVVISPPEVIEYHQAQGRQTLNRLEIPVTVVLGDMASKQAQESIDGYCSLTDENSSVLLAIESDTTLGGACFSAQVVRAATFRSKENWIAIDFIVEIYA